MEEMIKYYMDKYNLSEKQAKIFQAHHSDYMNHIDLKNIWQEAQKELLEELSKDYTVPLEFKIEQRLKELKESNK